MSRSRTHLAEMQGAREHFRYLRGQNETLLERQNRISLLHRPVGVYDECNPFYSPGHWVEIDGVETHVEEHSPRYDGEMWTCDATFLYWICSECCDSDDCLDERHHHTNLHEDRCPTMKIIEGAP